MALIYLYIANVFKKCCNHWILHSVITNVLHTQLYKCSFNDVICHFNVFKICPAVATH